MLAPNGIKGFEPIQTRNLESQTFIVAHLGDRHRCYIIFAGCRRRGLCDLPRIAALRCTAAAQHPRSSWGSTGTWELDAANIHLDVRNRHHGYPFPRNFGNAHLQRPVNLHINIGCSDPVAPHLSRGELYHIFYDKRFHNPAVH